MAGKPSGCGNNRRRLNWSVPAARIRALNRYANLGMAPISKTRFPGQINPEIQNDFPRAFVYKAAVLIGSIKLISLGAAAHPDF
jgi:hypothetical protein